MPRKTKQVPEGEAASFPSRLRQCMKEQKLSQSILGDAVGVQRQTISLYCTGQSKPDSDTLCALADRLGVTADWLLGRSDVREPSVALQAICDYTGLSEESVKELHRFKGEPGETINLLNTSVLYYLNLLLGDKRFGMAMYLLSEAQVYSYLRHQEVSFPVEDEGEHRNRFLTFDIHSKYAELGASRLYEEIVKDLMRDARKGEYNKFFQDCAGMYDELAMTEPIEYGEEEYDGEY